MTPPRAPDHGRRTTRKRRTSGEKDQASGVRWLTRIGVGAMLSILGSITWGLAEVGHARRRAESANRAATVLGRDLGYCLDHAASELNGMLDRSREPREPAGWRIELTRALEEQKRASMSAPLVLGLDRLSTELATVGVTVDQHCREWVRRRQRVTVELDAAAAHARRTASEIRQKLALTAGQQRLARLAESRSALGAGDRETMALARSVLAGKDPLRQIDSVSVEVGELSLLIERLTAARDSDQLTDLKDNLIGPCLARLRRTAGGLPDDLGRALRDLVTEIESVLFGKACLIDSAHQTIVSSEGGLYTLQVESLGLASEAAARRQEVNFWLATLTAERARLTDAADALSHELASESESLLGWALGTVLVVSLAAAGAFLSHGRKIARTIADQMTAIRRTTVSLEQTNAVLEKARSAVDLLHATATASNESESVAEALSRTLSAVSQWNGWSAAHAYLVKADEVTETGIWFQVVGGKFDRLANVTSQTGLQDDVQIPMAVARTGVPVPPGALHGRVASGRESAARAAGLTNCAAFPVSLAGRVVAVLEFFGGPDVVAREDTVQLMSSVAHHLAQAFEREEAARAKESTAKQLAELSREVGKAEIATGVLHNVGNVLNSVGVSAALLSERVHRSKVEAFQRAASMLRENDRRLAEYLTTDPRGASLPRYLVELSQRLARERDEIIVELKDLSSNVEHMKQTIAMQQSFGKPCGMTERMAIQDVIDDAVRINSTSLQRHGIMVVCETEFSDAVRVDRQRILMILVNLISNAIHAVRNVDLSERKIVVRTTWTTEGRIAVSVRDNGVGIPAANLSRIFSHGFSTRKDGHGFGLHSSAVTAGEMGGSLGVESSGPGEGATFTLTLPASIVEPAEVNA